LERISIKKINLKMKEEIGNLPGSSNIVCQCCRNPLSWREINQKDKTRFYVECGGDGYRYSRYIRTKAAREYICDSCVRDGKINAILSPN
jgi:hypothetical protein